MGLTTLVKKAYHAYRDNPMVNINTNIIIAGGISFTASLVAPEIAEMYTKNPDTISNVATAAKVLSFIPTHAGLHAWSNDKYHTEHGFNHRRYWGDIGKTYLTAIPSIISSLVAYRYIHNWIYEAILINAAATTGATAVSETVSRLVHIPVLKVTQRYTGLLDNK